MNTSEPERIPPSTSILILSPTASLISETTEQGAGVSSRTLPPCVETIIPYAPASAHLSALFAVIIPFMISGSFVADVILLYSSTDFVVTGLPMSLRLTSAAESTSIANPIAPHSSSFLTWCITLSYSQGFIVDIAIPSASFIIGSVAGKKLSSGPSPVKARVLQALAPKTTAFEYSDSSR